MGAAGAVQMLSNATRQLSIRVHRPELQEPPKPRAGGSFAARLPEPELWISTQDGSAAPRRLTVGGSCMKLQVFASPDGKTFAYTDSSGTLTMVHATKGVTRTVMRLRQGIGTAFSWNPPFADLQWSRNSQWIAFSAMANNSFSQVWLAHVDAPHQPVALTSSRVHSWSPSWSVDGNWLFFLSDRDLSHLRQVRGRG